MNKSCLRNCASPKKPNVSFSNEVEDSPNQKKIRTYSGNNERDLQNLARNKQRYLIIQQQREFRYLKVKKTQKTQCCCVF